MNRKSQRTIFIAGCVLAMISILSLIRVFSSSSCEQNAADKGEKTKKCELIRDKVQIADKDSSKVVARVIEQDGNNKKELGARLVTPDDIMSFNEAVDSGTSVEEAARKTFPDGTSKDGMLAAIKLASKSADAKVRCSAYKAVARLFTDEMDMAAALATAQALLSSVQSGDDDEHHHTHKDGEECHGGDCECCNSANDSGSGGDEDIAASDEGVEIVEEDEQTGPVELEITDEVEPLCDGAQGETIENMLKEGVTDNDATVRHEALTAASQMEDHFRYGAYEEIMRGNDSDLKKEVLELCSAFGREEDVAIQKKALEDADANVAMLAQKNLNSETAKSFMEAAAAAETGE